MKLFSFSLPEKPFHHLLELGGDVIEVLNLVALTPGPNEISPVLATVDAQEVRN